MRQTVPRWLARREGIGGRLGTERREARRCVQRTTGRSRLRRAVLRPGTGSGGGGRSPSGSQSGRVGALHRDGCDRDVRPLGSPRSLQPARVVAGLLAGTATICFQLAVQSGILTIAAVLTSLYPAVTVLLAAMVLRERIGRMQGIGLALAVTAVGLIASG